MALGRHVKLSKRFANRAKNLAGLLCERGLGRAMKAARERFPRISQLGGAMAPNAPMICPCYWYVPNLYLLLARVRRVMTLKTFRVVDKHLFFVTECSVVVRDGHSPRVMSLS